MGITTIILRLSGSSRITIHLLTGLVCSIPLFIPAIVLLVVQAKAGNFPSAIQVEAGEANGLCLGALCCVIVMTILAALWPMLV